MTQTNNHTEMALADLLGKAAPLPETFKLDTLDKNNLNPLEYCVDKNKESGVSGQSKNSGDAAKAGKLKKQNGATVHDASNDDPRKRSSRAGHAVQPEARVSSGAMRKTTKPKVSSNTFSRTASRKGFVSAIEKQRADYAKPRANKSAPRQRVAQPVTSNAEKLMSAKTNATKSGPTKSGLTKAALKKAALAKITRAKMARAQNAQRIADNKADNKMLPADKSAGAMSKAQRPAAAASSEKAPALHTKKKISLKENSKNNVGASSKAAKQTNTKQASVKQQHDVGITAPSYLSLAPLEEPGHQPAQVVKKSDAAMVQRVGYGVSAAPSVNRGVFYAQPKSRAGHVAEVALPKKGKRRRRQKIPRQVFSVVFMAILGGVIIWQEIEYGKVGEFVSELFADERVVETWDRLRF